MKFIFAKILNIYLTKMKVGDKFYSPTWFSLYTEFYGNPGINDDLMWKISQNLVILIEVLSTFKVYGKF